MSGLTNNSISEAGDETDVEEVSKSSKAKEEVNFEDNNYGYTKLLMEKIFLESHTYKNKFTVCRFGNVSHSHGSVIPFWLRLHADNKPLLLTHKSMNRLMFSREEAVKLVHKAIIKTNKEDEPFILSQKMKSVNMFDLAHIISDKVKIVGIRPGEKLNEELIIGNNVYSTDHSQILKAEEKSFDWDKIEDKTLKLKAACESLEISSAIKILKECVNEWSPSSNSEFHTKYDPQLQIDKKSDIAEC